MGYKGSYKTIRKGKLQDPSEQPSEDLLSRCNDTFFAHTPFGRLERLMSRISTAVCLGCGRRLSRHLRFCAACEMEYRRAKTWQCGVCGRPLPDCDCSSAYLFRNHVPRAAKLLHYHTGNGDAVENRIILYLKRRDERAIFRFFAAEMKESVRRLIPKTGEVVLTFIPRPRDRRALFGFDQAERLAQALGECLSLPVLPSLKRVRFASSQKEQETMKERVENAKRSFRICTRTPLTGKTVLLVDDIITTGATMVAAADVLRRNGAKRIYAVALATAMRHPNIKYEHAANTHIPWYENR